MPLPAILPLLGKVGKGLATTLPFIGQMFGSASAAKQTRENTQRTIAAQKEMQEYAYSKDLEMWNKQNIYNSPVEQINRLKEGGLNPRMIYGSSPSGASGMASQMPKYQAPKPDYSRNQDVKAALLNTLGQYNTFRIQSAQADTLEERAQQEMMSTELQAAKQDWLFTKSKFASNWNKKMQQGEIVMKPNWAQQMEYQKTFLEQRNEHTKKKVINNELKNFILGVEKEAWDMLGKEGKITGQVLPWLKILKSLLGN